MISFRSENLERVDSGLLERVDTIGDKWEKHCSNTVITRLNQKLSLYTFATENLI